MSAERGNWEDGDKKKWLVNRRDEDLIILVTGREVSVYVKLRIVIIYQKVEPAVEYHLLSLQHSSSSQQTHQKVNVGRNWTKYGKEGVMIHDRGTGGSKRDSKKMKSRS